MHQYIAPILRWWWLILLATILAGGSSYYAVSRQAPVYEVRATLVIGRSFTNPNPNSGELYLEQQLATAYANFGTRQQVITATMKALNLDVLPQFFVRTVPNTPLIEVLVSDTNPERAVAVANEVANQIIQSSFTGKEKEQQAQQLFLKDQIQKIQDQIKTTEAEIAAAQEKLSTLTSARQIADTQAQIGALQQKLLSLQSNYADLVRSTLEGAVNSLALVQAAELPTGPVGPNKLLYVALAAALGLAISTASAFGLDLIDNTYKTEEDLIRALNAPIIGKIPKIPSNVNHWAYSSHLPESPVADAFRMLRTNLDFIGVGKPLRSILVAGPELEMGKSVIATNLALIYSQGEKKTILVEGDLRRPRLATALEAGEYSGITDICLDRISISDTLIPWKNGKEIKGTKAKLPDNGGNENPGENKLPENNKSSDSLFYFLPAGTIPPNPAEILSSSKFDQLMKDLNNRSNIIIVDSPPLFLPDASVLLRKVDGVILIIELGRTSKKSIKMSLDQISRSGTTFIGIVLNKVKSRQTYYSKYR